MPTIACYIQMLRPGQHTQAHRHVCCTNYHVIEGSGYSLVGGRQLDWEDKDVFTVPTWTFHEHVNTGNRPAFLFSFTDAPVMKALDLYREEAKGNGRRYSGAPQLSTSAWRARGDHTSGITRRRYAAPALWPTGPPGYGLATWAAD